MDDLQKGRNELKKNCCFQAHLQPFIVLFSVNGCKGKEKSTETVVSAPLKEEKCCAVDGLKKAEIEKVHKVYAELLLFRLKKLLILNFCV